MAITYSFVPSGFVSTTLSTAPRGSLNWSAGDIILTFCCVQGGVGAVTMTGGTGLTWTLLASTASGFIYYAVAPSAQTTQAIIFSAGAASYCFMAVYILTGAGIPFSTGNGSAAAPSSISHVITPTTSGSALFLFPHQNNGGASSGLTATGGNILDSNIGGAFAMAGGVLRPNPNPRTTNGAVTLSVTNVDTTFATSWIGIEVPLPPSSANVFWLHA